MTTPLLHLLMRRFRRRYIGRAVAGVVALMLGLTLLSKPATAASFTPPTVRVKVNGQPAVDVNGTLIPPLTLSAALDSQLNPFIPLAGTYYVPGFSAAVKIDPVPDGRIDVPRVFFVVPVEGGTALMVASDMYMTSLGPNAGELTLALDSNDMFGFAAGGLHTYGATMDGSVLGFAPAGVIQVTAVAKQGEAQDIINVIPPGAGDVGPSLIAGTAAAPLKPGGLFTGAVTENIQCGGVDVSCFLQMANTIDFAFANPGDVIFVSGSFGVGVVTQPCPGTPPNCAGNTALLLRGTGVPFDGLRAAVATQPAWDTFEVGAVFTLGPLSAGIDPPSETFRLHIGQFSAMLPANSFVRHTLFGTTFYTFDGSANGGNFHALILPLGGKSFSLFAAGHGADLTSSSTFIDLAIGPDKGSTAAPVFLGRVD